MNMNAMKTNGVKLLAAVMVMAMVFAGASVILGDSEVNAAPVNTDNMINLQDYKEPGEEYSFDSETSTLTLNGYNGTQGFYYNAALKIVVAGENSITVTTDANATDGKAFAAIYTTSGAITIEDDVSTNTDKLTITVNGTTTGTGGSEWTYGIYSPAGLTVSDIAVDITVATADKYAFAIEGNGSATTFTNVTGTVTGGNRAIQMGGATLTFDNTDMELYGGEKAIQCKTVGGSVVLTNKSEITLGLIDNPGSNTGADDYFGLKVQTLTVGQGCTLETQGLNIIGTVTNNGIIKVNGGYTQNPAASIANPVAGLYYVNMTGNAIDAYSAAPAGDSYILLANGADWFGKVVVKDASGTVTEKAPSEAKDSNSSVSKLMADDAVDSIYVSNASALDTSKVEITKPVIIASTVTVTGINFDIKEDGSVTSLGAAVSGTITNGTVNSVTLTSLAGNYTMSQGSVIIAGELTGGSITNVSGEVSIKGELNAEGNVTISSTGSAYVDLSGLTIAKGTLVLQNVAVSSDRYVDNAGTIQFGTGTTIDGALSVNGGNISGAIVGGTLNTNGTVTLNAATSVGEKARVVINGTMDASNTLTNAGTINVYGTLSGTVENNGKIVLLSKDASVPTNMTGTGTVDSSAISAYVELSGELETVTEYGVYQNVTIIGNTTLLKGSKITISGTLVINENVTLTIEDGAQLVINGSAATLTNNGTIVVQSDVTSSEKAKDGTTSFTANGGFVVSNATFDNYGTVNLAYVLLNNETAGPAGTSATFKANSNINNYGTITVSESNTLVSIASLVNKADAVLNMNGIVGSVTVSNAGTVNVDGSANGLAINQAAAGAVVNVYAVVGSVTVSDAGMTYSKTLETGSNQVVISSGTYTGTTGEISGIVVSSDVVKKTVNGADKYYRDMQISGSADATVSDGTTPSTASIAVTGTVGVSGTFAATDAVSISGGALVVSGEMMLEDGSKLSGMTVTVTGSLVAGSKPLATSTIINAAMYVVTGSDAKKTYYYTNLADAITGATAASVKEVTVTGEIDVEADVTIPAGMTVKQSGTMTIDEGKTVTVEATGKLDARGTVKVDGTLYVADKSSGINRSASIESQVKSEGEKDVRYTNLANAIASAGTGDVTIKLNGRTVVESDLVIPSNVTVDTNNNDFSVSGAKLTVDGTLYLNGGNYSVSNVTSATGVVKTGSVVINGYMKSMGTLVFDGVKYPAGAYYAIGQYSYITAVSNAPAVIADAEDQTVDIYGKVSAGDLAFTGTEDEPLTINVKASTVAGTADFAAGTITLSYASLVFENGKNVSATIATAEGSVAVKDVQTTSRTSFVSAEDADGAKVMTVDGGFSSITGNEKTYAAVFAGDVTVGKLTLAEVKDAKYTYYSMTVDGNVTLVDGAAVLKYVLVNGTLHVDNGVSATIDKADVLGSVTVAEAGSDVAGSLKVNDLKVGITSEDIIITVGAAATISGSVDYDTMYVAAGSTVPADMIKDVKFTTFQIEGAEWITVYDKTGVVKIDSISTEVSDAKFEYWVGEDGVKIEDKEIGDVETVSAYLDYKVFAVRITADNGIGTVAVDGVVLYKNSNQFVATGLTAGEHTITFELKNGYQGTVKMTVNGTTVDGYKFTLSGYDADKVEDVSGNDYMVFDINLSGTTQIEYDNAVDSSTGMGLTDYLLIILVFLILVMAVMVALRLMRS